MTFAESVQFLYSLGHELKAIKWGLERSAALLARSAIRTKKAASFMWPAPTAKARPAR